MLSFFYGSRCIDPSARGAERRPQENGIGGTGMTHSQALELNDFVNRVAPVEPRTVMQTRGGTRRKRFVETAALRQKVAHAAAAEASYQPAAEKVFVVKAALPAAGFSATLQEAGGVLQLVHDSFSQPVLSGIRSASRPIRQLLYRADPYQIDIQIELQRDGIRLVIIGQFLVDSPTV